jgi:drug/metabolite transporter (DMT)-like permease
LGLFLLGTFQLGISYILYTKAILHVTAFEAILIPVIEPLLNPIWVLIFINEKPGAWALLGGVVVILSITFRSLFVLKSRNLTV